MKHKHPSKPSTRKPHKAAAGNSIPWPSDRSKSALPDEQNASTVPIAMLWMLPALSGFACLIYQILWMRQASVLLGSTSHAAALTLAVFFGGLSIGGWYWGNRCQNKTNPLRTYAWMELGIAVAGIVLLVAPVIVPRVYPMLHQESGKGLAMMAFKVISTLLLVFPASFLMGGTLPLLGQAVIRSRASFGTITARMYAVNTMGAACGAFATAFLLIAWLGLRMTCVTAMGASIAAALLALRLSRQTCFQVTSTHAIEEDESGNPQQKKKSNQADSPAAGKPAIARPIIIVLAFVSGFNLLALEVVWARMLAQLHENSVYSFATVLIVVLVCLSLGAWLASQIARSKIPAPQVLLWLFVLGGAALAITPVVSTSLTEGMKMLATDFTFPVYVLRLFATGFATIGLACLPLGAVFPFLMKGEERFIIHAGKSIGMLSAINTIGAILGSLAAGFLLLEWLGVWHTIQLVSAIYLVVAVLTPARGSAGTYSARIASVILLVLLFTDLDPARLPAPSYADATGESGKLVEQWEGSDCTVSVVEKTGNRLSIKINSNYGLGSTDAYAPQIFQARIPLLAYPASQSVFFLGMGTGITAGEALNRSDFKDVKKVVACELSANVVAASKKYFTGKTGSDLTNGLYQDPRAEVVIGDGRNLLMASGETYSMINADLFLPYRRGTGNLYSREHFQIVRERLNPGGVFVQWLPLYQMTEQEFGIIAHTMMTVFPQVSLWRGNFQPGAEIAALVGHADLTPLPACALDVEDQKRVAVQGATHLDMQELMLPINEQTILLFYGGNLTRAADLFDRYPLNTDDKPVIEFGTPRSLHQPASAGRPQFLETRFANLVDKLQSRTPPDEDPLLISRSRSNRKLPLAGSAFHRGWIARVHGNEKTWMKEWKTFLDQWSDSEPATGSRE